MIRRFLNGATHLRAWISEFRSHDLGFGFQVQMKVLFPEFIREIKQTQGSETSQYLEERTSTETPVVVASEPGPGQCCREIKSNGLERPTIAGDSPVDVK